MLSVSGARGIVGKSMTPEVARKFSEAFASHIRGSLLSTARPRLVIGRDGRGSGAELAEAVAAGVCESGFDVIDLGVVSTPTVALMIGHLGAIGGIVLTASHNPIEWNGLKTLNAEGLALTSTEADQVIARFRGPLPVASTPRGSRALRDEGDQVHVDRVLANIDIQSIRSRRFHVALDSVNGGGARSGKMLLEALGCELLHLNGECTGTFAHTPEPIEANLGQLANAVGNARSIAIGFAQDPDADRLALVDERGRFIGEEYTLVLGATRLLQRHGRGDLATNLSTSRMIDDVVAQFPSSQVIRTAVGEANVVAGIRECGGIGGGEGNGGLIWPEICWVRDSLSAMALVLELMAHDGRPLSQIIAGIRPYAMIKRKLDLVGLGGQGAMADAFNKVRKEFTRRTDVKMNETDGIRIDFPEGWVHLRASNTEPIIRLSAEATDRTRAEALCEACARAAGFA